MEDLQMQLEKAQSDLVFACARLRGTDVLAHNVEDLRRENDALREQLQRYEDALLSVENRLESFATLHGAENLPGVGDVQKPVAFSNLLEENQRLNAVVEEMMMQRQRLSGQDGQLLQTFGFVSEERAALEERIEELQADNDFLRDELEQAQTNARTARNSTGTSGTSDISAMEERLERSERTVATKSHLCELLAAEVQRLDSELRNVQTMAESTGRCVTTANEQCPHQTEVSRLNQVNSEMHQEVENMRRQRQEDGATVTRMREEFERHIKEQHSQFEQRVQEQHAQLQQEHQEHIKAVEKKAAAEKQEATRNLQLMMAQLNENYQTLKKKHNQMFIQLKQAPLKLEQMTADRDHWRDTANRLKEIQQQQSTQIAELSDNNTRLYVEVSGLKKMRESVPAGLMASRQFSAAPPSSNQFVPPGYVGRGLPRGLPTASQAVSDGIGDVEEQPMSWLPPQDRGSGQQQSTRTPSASTASSGPSAAKEKECPICKKVLMMDEMSYYKHCDDCAASQG